MNSRSGRSQRIRHNYMKIYLLTGALCLVAAVIVGLTVLNVTKGVLPETPEPTTQAPETPTPTAQPTDTQSAAPTETEPTQTPVSSIERLVYGSADLAKASPLMIVNDDHPFKGTLTGMINAFQEKNKSVDAPIALAKANIDMRKEAFWAFEKLHFAVNAEFPALTLQIVAAYTDDPGTVYCTSTHAEKPCLTDEHITGYAADCWFITKNNKGETVSLHFSNAAAAQQTNFMLQKAAELGIIQSKVNLVGHTQNDLRHLRYVGVPHASYIYENKITLDEYVETVKSFNFNKRLTLTVAGTEYEVYYVKATGDETTVPVPADSNYSVVSNNVDGYIVTITK